MFKINWSVQEVELAEIDKGTWSEYFESYLIDPTGHLRFLKDVEHQQGLIEALLSDIGLGADSQRILEGLAPKVKIWRRWVSLQKAKAVADMVRAELAEGLYKRIAVFAVHPDPLAELENQLRDIGVIKMFRGTPEVKRYHLWKKFAREGGRPIALLHLVDGHALPNLSLIQDAIFIEPSWVQNVNIEAAMRLCNGKQTRDVNIRFIAAARSIDLKITNLLKTKTKVSPQFDRNNFL